MTSTRIVKISVCALALSSAAMHAQGGCFHSPEAPTSVLLLVGSAGMFYGSSLVTKIAARLRQK